MICDELVAVATRPVGAVGAAAPPLDVVPCAVLIAVLNPTGGVNVEPDAAVLSAASVVPLDVIAPCKAVKTSSIALPLVGLNETVSGLIAVKALKPSAVLTCVKAVATAVGVSGDTAAALSPANHVAGVPEPAKFETTKSVMGVTLTVPAVFATE